MDEDFIFGTHVLVACVTTKGATNKEVYLPAIANDGETGLMWCERETGVWYAGKGESIILGEFPLLLSCTLLI